MGTEHLTYTVKAYDWESKKYTTVVCADYAAARKTAHGLGHQTKVVGYNRSVVRAIPTREVAIFHRGREVVRYVGGHMVTESTLAEARAAVRPDPEAAKKAKRSAAAKKAAATRKRNRELAKRLVNDRLALGGAA